MLSRCSSSMKSIHLIDSDILSKLDRRAKLYRMDTRGEWRSVGIGYVDILQTEKRLVVVKENKDSTVAFSIREDSHSELEDEDEKNNSDSTREMKNGEKNKPCCRTESRSFEKKHYDHHEEENDTDLSFGGMKLLWDSAVQSEDSYSTTTPTTIVWTELDESVDMALSFQLRAGAIQIRNLIRLVERNSNDPNLSTNASSCNDLFETGANYLSTDYYHENNAENFEFDLIPIPQWSTIDIITNLLTRPLVHFTPSQHDRLVHLLCSEDWLSSFTKLFKEAEETNDNKRLESLSCVLRRIFDLKDINIFDAFSTNEEIYQTVLGVMEHDTTFPQEAHRKFKPLYVAPGGGAAFPKRILNIIHQIYRLQYLRDCVMIILMDEAAMTQLSVLHYHLVRQVLEYTMSNVHSLWEKLWKQPSLHASSFRFVHELLGHLRLLMGDEREQLLSALGEPEIYGPLLSAACTAISESFQFSKNNADSKSEFHNNAVMACDLLVLLASVRPQSIWEFCDVNEVSRNSQQLPSLLIDLLIGRANEHDGDVKKFPSDGDLLQLAEVCRVLLEVPANPSTCATVNRLYAATSTSSTASEGIALRLLDGIIESDHSVENPNGNVLEILYDLLCYIVTNHVGRARYLLSKRISAVLDILTTMLRSESPRSTVLVASLKVVSCMLRTKDSIFASSIEQSKVLPAIAQFVHQRCVADGFGWGMTVNVALGILADVPNITPVHIAIMEHEETRQKLLEIPNAIINASLCAHKPEEKNFSTSSTKELVVTDDGLYRPSDDEAWFETPTSVSYFLDTSPRDKKNELISPSTSVQSDLIKNLLRDLNAVDDDCSEKENITGHEAAAMQPAMKRVRRSDSEEITCNQVRFVADLGDVCDSKRLENLEKCEVPKDSDYLKNGEDAISEAYRRQYCHSQLTSTGLQIEDELEVYDSDI